MVKNKNEILFISLLVEVNEASIKSILSGSTWNGSRIKETYKGQ